MRHTTQCTDIQRQLCDDSSRPESNVIQYQHGFPPKRTSPQRADCEVAWGVWGARARMCEATELHAERPLAVLAMMKYRMSGSILTRTYQHQHRYNANRVRTRTDQSATFGPSRCFHLTIHLERCSSWGLFGYRRLRDR